MLDLSTVKKSALVLCGCSALITGLIIDSVFGHKLDYWIHDSALVFQHRTAWNHSAIVVLDDNVPYSVSRKQALPLFSRAADQLISAGAKGLFLDARVSKTQEGRMPYAQCIETDGSVRWSMPECSTSTTNQCDVNNSELGNAPLKMDAATITNFLIAPYLDDSNEPELLLYDWEAAEAIPPEGIVASDRLVTLNSPIARWLDLSSDHAVYKLITFSLEQKTGALYNPKASDELCNTQYPCRRIRLSKPIYKIQTQGEQLIIPVSSLASCDTSVAAKTATLLKNKLIILQTTAPNESTDLVVTAMTTAIFGPSLMTTGAQFLIDAIETLINQDSPQPPAYLVKLLLFTSIAIISIIAGIYLTQTYLWLLGMVLFISISLLCFFNPIVQLWPLFASLSIYFVGAGQLLAIHLFLGRKERKITKQYIPEQLHQLLMSLKIDESFKSRHCHAVVLMSDLAGYTTVTGLLKEPDLILELMNDYLEATSLVLHKKYAGILEAYVGDLVCYYWTDLETDNRQEMCIKALNGAIELRELQKQFFLTLQQRYKSKIDSEALQRIIQIIDAGIGITAGKVVMGNLGPEKATQKLSILGDPLNLAARIESLTRLFNTDIIIAGDFLDAVELSGLITRRLGSMKVKGRVQPETLYALGCTDDPRFSEQNIADWTQWLEQIESGAEIVLSCPTCYKKDEQTIKDWLSRNLLSKDGLWLLDKK
jgi:adenylate cyclase